MGRPSRPWFRFYVEAVHDRKLRRLRPEYRWLFVACLAAARQSCEPGWLLVGKDDPMGSDDLVDFAGMPSRAVEQGTNALREAGVLGYDLDRETWFIPSWDSRQYESDDVTARTRKHRAKERSNDVPGNDETALQGTPWGRPDTETDTETDPPPPTPAPLRSARTANERAETLRTAADLIGERVSLGPSVRNPAAMRRSVAQGVMADRYAEAYQLLATDPAMTPADLADRLDPGPKPGPRGRLVSEVLSKEPPKWKDGAASLAAIRAERGLVKAPPEAVVGEP